jgi:hypothetical protein
MSSESAEIVMFQDGVIYEAVRQQMIAFNADMTRLGGQTMTVPLPWDDIGDMWRKGFIVASTTEIHRLAQMLELLAQHMTAQSN